LRALRPGWRVRPAHPVRRRILPVRAELRAAAGAAGFDSLRRTTETTRARRGDRHCPAVRRAQPGSARPRHGPAQPSPGTTGPAPVALAAAAFSCSRFISGRRSSLCGTCEFPDLAMRCGTSVLRIWRKHMTHTTAADWSVAVFSSRESVSHLQKVVAACELACRERSAIIDVIVNGNASLAAEFRQSLV